MAKPIQTETECPGCGSFIEFQNGICKKCGFPEPKNIEQFSTRDRLMRVRSLIWEHVKGDEAAADLALMKSENSKLHDAVQILDSTINKEM